MTPTSRTLPVLLVGGLLAVAIIAVGLWAGARAVSADGTGVPAAYRLAGIDRSTTAAQLSQAAWPEGADTVYLIGEGDPLTATAAGMPGGPVFVVQPCQELPTALGQELTRLSPDRVVAVGGDAAICDEVLRQALAFAGR